MEKIWFQIINRDGTPQTIKDAEGHDRPCTVGAENEGQVDEYRRKGWREIVPTETEEQSPVPGKQKDPPEDDKPRPQDEAGDVREDAPADSVTDEGTSADEKIESPPSTPELSAENDHDHLGKDAVSNGGKPSFLPADENPNPKNITGSRGGRKR